MLPSHPEEASWLYWVASMQSLMAGLLFAFLWKKRGGAWVLHWAAGWVCFSLRCAVLGLEGGPTTFPWAAALAEAAAAAFFLTGSSLLWTWPSVWASRAAIGLSFLCAFWLAASRSDWAFAGLLTCTSLMLAATGAAFLRQRPVSIFAVLIAVLMLLWAANKPIVYFLQKTDLEALSIIALPPLAMALSGAAALIFLENVENALKASMIELRRTNSALERFSSIIAHDLKEPCRQMSLQAQFLSSQFGENMQPKALEYLEYLNEAGRRMTTLLDAMQSFLCADSKDEVRYALQDLNTLFAEALNLTKSQFADHECVFECRTPHQVWGNQEQLIRLFAHILSNCAKYRAAERRQEIYISSHSIRDSIEIKISDNGIGIPGDQRDDVFAPAVRLHAHSDIPGSGFGLALARLIVENHGGTIRIAANDEYGISVLVSLSAHPPRINLTG